MRSSANLLMELIYPRRCPVCREMVNPKGAFICTKCREQLIFIEEPCCKKCGKPLLLTDQEYCFDCIKGDHHYSKGFSLCIYNERMKQVMSDYKFLGKKEYVDFFALELVNRYQGVIKELEIGAIVPVPLHKSKKNKRGYNQATLLATRIGTMLEIPVIPDLLCRNRNTIPQKMLDNKERLRNLQQAFSFSNNIRHKNLIKVIPRVLIVDDIYTTGSTIEACTNVLLREGVEEVYFLTVCIGLGF